MRSFRFAIAGLLFATNSVLAQTPIDTSLAVRIGGIKQWINISTRDNAKPLLLFLNGGPGESAMGAREYFTNKLQERFVVVLWDLPRRLFLRHLGTPRSIYRTRSISANHYR